MSDEPQETSYYLRLLSMYMDLGTEIVLDVFVYHSPGQDAETFLKSKQDKIIHLKDSSVLNSQECALLFQKGKYVLKSRLEIKRFDISLLITLSRNLLTDLQLAPPVKGWIHPPRNSDKSIAADLMRLKKIRNVIVGHHPKARLPFWRFDEEWKNASEIFLRLQDQIAPGKVVRLQERIEAYRLQFLDPTVKTKYEEKLKEWHHEVTTMQDQVEELIKKLGGFEAYFNNKSDRFERYTKLLFTGGHFVLSAFLDKKIKDEGKDLYTMLIDNEQDIRRDISDEEQLNKLYPTNPPSPTDPADTSSWNISLLTTVILQLFNTSEEKGVIESVKEIGEANRKYSDATLLALDSNAFEDYWTDLKSSMKIVSHQLDKDTAKRYYQILDECKKTIDEKEFKTYIEELKTQGTQIKSFTETFQDVLQRTKDALQDMIIQGISFKHAQVLELKMITLGSDEEQKKLAEEILTEVWNEALDRAVQSTDFLNVKREVLTILEEIKKSKSVENISVKSKCILLQIKCTSPCEMLDMIDYFHSSQFHETIRHISIELGYFFDTAVDVYSVITVECLWRMYNHTNKIVHDEEGGLSLQMTVSSPAGMKHLMSLCSKGTVANCTNSISDALSKHLGGTIALKAVADMKDFKHVFDTDCSSSDSCSDCSSIESNVQDNNSQNQIDDGQQTVEECSDDVEEVLNKQIDSANYALKNLTLTSIEALEEKDEQTVNTDKTLIGVDEGLTNMGKGTILEDTEKALKEKQVIKDVDYQDTNPIGTDSEELFETIALMELYQSQIAVAQYLELAYHSLQDSPDIAQEILSTSKVAKNAQERTLFENESGLNPLKHMMSIFKEDAIFTQCIENALEEANDLRVRTKESKERYITLHTEVKRNIQKVEQSVCLEEKSGEDEHTSKEKMSHLSDVISKVEISTKTDIVSTQHKNMSDVTEIQPENTAIQPENTAIKRGVVEMCVKSEFAEIQPEFTEIQSEVSEIQPESTTVQPDVVEIQPQVLEIQPEVAEIQTEVAEIQLENTTIQTEVAEIHPEETEIQSEVTRIQPENTTIQPEIAEKQPEVTKVQFDVTEIQPESTEIQPEAAEMQPKVTEIQSEVTEIGLENTEIQPLVAEIHQFKYVMEEKLHKTSGFMDKDLFAMKTRVEETVLHKLRPGLAITGGIASSVLGFFNCCELFKLIRQVNESDLRMFPYNFLTTLEIDDIKIPQYADYIVAQRLKVFDRLNKIQRKEEHKGLECLKEVTRHLENIHIQLTRIIACWSELADDMEFLLKNKEMLLDIKPMYEYNWERRQEWKAVRHQFRAYGLDDNCTAILYRFITTEDENVLKRQPPLKDKI